MTRVVENLRRRVALMRVEATAFRSARSGDDENIGVELAAQKAEKNAEEIGVPMGEINTAKFNAWKAANLLNYLFGHR